MKPRIGISTSVITDASGAFAGYDRTYVNKDYVDAVIRNGAIPIMIPFNTDPSVIEAQLEGVDALILSGGHDVWPLNYQQQPQQRLGTVFPERDLFELTLLKYAVSYNIPVLGICRGLQIMNVFFGGSLHQDLSYMDGAANILKHDQGSGPTLLTHTVRFKENSMLYKLLGDDLLVNSFHHQTLKQLGDGLIAVGHADDGVIEAVEHESLLIYGVQWHPEMLSATEKAMNAIFKQLVKWAGERHV
ncbi:gamma-glutamyl-gamma-aminobutyrate hydrolase family protein [Erysipelothrix sp. HDW6C]|uniref:gamma-glutamyl-gamma-aminobutyrate hydrolase family protein n=1 Tax=Erysipelothrix sp. HDW6C TaxID=2714930 RepID=UPI0014079A13|nr:gamma-glutamyl-gamma-aminobutyrate hydrolase family protein [Erysipelothrix sp. HDW6C]QIK70107.1 gamma-glutamyl-gamma-aminobutyrate hydrolase family protein [Erysipelothrix sp. HDW6C]